MSKKHKAKPLSRSRTPSPLRSALVDSPAYRIRPNGSKFYRQTLPLIFYEQVMDGIKEKYGLNRTDVRLLSAGYLLYSRGFVWWKRKEIDPLILTNRRPMQKQLADLVSRGWLVYGSDEWHRLSPDQRPPTSRGRGKGVGFYALSQRGKMVVDEITALLTILIREDLERFLIQIGRTIQPT